MIQREIILTVYRIQTDLLNVTIMSDQHQNFRHGYVTIHAEGDGERHSWQTLEGDRYRVGDRITCRVLEDDPPTRRDDDPQPPPPIDKREACPSCGYRRD